ncbi:MAG: PadR family transcriptional regulator [Dehalococcoidia bacterium]
MVRQLLLLGVLLGGKMHGYRLNEYVTHAMSLYTDLKKSTAYYTLQKLEKDGYVQIEVEREGRRPERRVYQITEKGRACFFDLLRRHLSGFTRTYYVDDIGIAFMDQLSTAQARQLLAAKREKIQAVLQQFRGLPGHGGNWRHVISHNIAHLEVEVAWLNSVLSELDDVEA